MHKFAIIVSYRDRAQHLSKFIPYMKARFKNLDIFVIEQEAGKPFNRGKLLNIGVIEAGNSYDYFALHDVDMLPIQADYTPPTSPTLLATKAQQFGYTMPYPEYFSGVVLMSREDIYKVNGYHNEFWGWGGEDNHFRDRVLQQGLTIAYRNCTFKSLPHDRKIDSKLHQKNYNLWKSGTDSENGISNCVYQIISRDGNHIKVSI